jgi:hypothetical protein
MDWRRKLALWLCPDLALAVTPAVSPALPLEAEVASKCGAAMDQKAALITLAETLATHQGVTHFAISMRALGKGDFFKRLTRPGAGCHIRTAERLMRFFDQTWPSDLAWPPSIPRPSDKKDVA